ncbi:hypothetical protein H4R34_005591 [Dimargaris verticillata]|uniref:Carbohydrate-binding module family 19 domain-containing protein n=1 Tax=Dimargaris verticillata TaxID=2761393 RepID=A0A9W8AYN1_9FUNG|nr:hypothetical protein H4R34_005591 [Dimargaris verticillata]
MFKATILLLSALAAGCSAHMYPSSPCMRGSPLAECNYDPKDYSLSAPIGTDGSQTFPLCHHTTPFKSSQGTYNAGDSIKVAFQDGATHNGGNCEFSLSYDDGKTFVSIKTIMDNCFLEGLTFDVPIPENAPSGDMVVFAWSWVNKTGNREFYMTCSDITIKGSPNGVLTGPKMLTPNYGDGPRIEEFTNGGDNGSKFYEDRPNISVKGDGSGGQPESTPDSSESSESAAPTAYDGDNNAGKKGSGVVTRDEEKTTKPSKPIGNGNKEDDEDDAPTTTSSAAPEPSSKKGEVEGGSSSGSVYSCKASGKLGVINIKDNGKTVILECAKGLVCIEKEAGNPYCGYPEAA